MVAESSALALFAMAAWAAIPEGVSAGPSQVAGNSFVGAGHSERPQRAAARCASVVLVRDAVDRDL